MLADLRVVALASGEAATVCEGPAILQAIAVAETGGSEAGVVILSGADGVQRMVFRVPAGDLRAVGGLHALLPAGAVLTAYSGTLGITLALVA